MFTTLYSAKTALVSAYTSAKEAVVNTASYAKESVVSKAKANVQFRAEKFIQEKSKDMGSYFKDQLHNFVFKEKELFGKVQKTGDLVEIYKVNPHLIQTIIKKITGFDVEADIPLIPGSVAKLVFSKLDTILVAKLEEQVMELSNLSSKFSLIAVSEAAGVSQQFIESQLSKMGEEDSNSVLSDKSAEDILNQATVGLSDDEKSDFTKLVDTYLAKMKIYLNGRVEEAVSQTATHYAGELVDNGIVLAENYIKAGIGAAAIIGAGALNSALGVITTAALYAEDKVEVPENISYISSISKYVTTHFLSKYIQKDTIQQAAHNNAIIAVQKYMPAAFAITSEIYKNAGGTYKETEINDLDMSFLMLEQDEQPMTLTNFLQKVPSNVYSAITGIFSENELDVEASVNGDDVSWLELWWNS